jgi:hypothetical protein
MLRVACMPTLTLRTSMQLMPYNFIYIYIGFEFHVYSKTRFYPSLDSVITFDLRIGFVFRASTLFL